LPVAGKHALGHFGLDAARFGEIVRRVGRAVDVVADGPQTAAGGVVVAKLEKLATSSGAGAVAVVFAGVLAAGARRVVVSVKHLNLGYGYCVT